jgi:hypothetical protein
MEHVKHLVDIATILAPFLSFVIGILTVVVLREQLRLSRDLGDRTDELTRELKRADIVQALNTRYDRLWQLRHNPSAVEDAASFFLRFWSLQLDQFAQWRAKFVPDDDYATWLQQRRGDYERDWKFRDMGLVDGWKLAKTEMAENSAFFVLLDKVMVQRVQGDDLRKAMDQARRAA